MKTKITFILLLLLFVMGGSAFAQVQINAPTSYQPVSLSQGGAPGTYKVDIVNNNPAVLNATFSLALPAGMEYVAGTITGATQLSIANLQSPTFTLNSIPIGNTLTITFDARINCGYSTSTINYSVISGGSTVATGSSPVAGNTPAPAYVLPAVPSPQILTTPLNTNALRTIKFKNSGVLPVTTVYVESAVATASQSSSYKVMSANNGTVSSITNGYRVTLTGTALQNAITTTVGGANASFDPGEEITIVLTEQMLSCATGASIALNMKAGSGDTKGSLCFYDGSTASISTEVGNPAISLTRLAGTTWPTFCTNGKVSYTIKNEGTGPASSIFNIKLPWSTNYTLASAAPNAEPEGAFSIKKVFINGTDVTSFVLTRNGTGSSALIPGQLNCFVIDLSALTSAYGSALQSLNGDGRFDDLAAGQSIQLDFEYGFNISSYKTCSLNSVGLPSTGADYFTLGTSYLDQCGTRAIKTNYSAGAYSDYTKTTFQVGCQQYNSFSTNLSATALQPGDKIKLTTSFGGQLSSAFAQGSGNVIKTFTFILPDGLDYDSTGTTRFMYNATGTIIPANAINYNVATKTLSITPLATLVGLNASNDNFEIPLIVSGSGSIVNKTLEYSATIGFTGCGITAPYGCSSSTLNYAIIDTNCATVGTTSFDITRATFGYAVAPTNTNIWYTPTAFVNENTAGINLHGAVSKDKVKTTFTGIVNSTSFTELWARVKYTSNSSNITQSNFDKLSAVATDVAGTITVTKASDGSTLSTNITVADIVFSYDSGTSRQLQQVNIGAKIGIGKDIDYTLQVGDKIAVNWFTKVTRDNLSYIYSALPNLEGDLYTKDAVGTASDCQPIPVSFFIQRLYLLANGFTGVQAVVGLNSMRVMASLLNGNYPQDVSGDHFPNEVRNYAIFRNVKLTIPGIWIMDPNVGKEPYISASGQVALYKVNPSIFTVTYSGGNTIVTADNIALGSNGLPLSTANIPVVSDWIGANGNQNLSIYMLPVCATPGVINVSTIQNYDLYTTAADNSNTESYIQNIFSQGGSVTYYNYSANAAPTLQNVDGIGSTVDWQVKVTNTSDTATIVAAGGDANLPNNWISFVAPNNNITVTKVTDIATSIEYPVLNYGAGKYWVKLGAIATSATYDVKATYTACTDDKLRTTYSFGATGYPDNPDENLDASVSTCAASQTKFDLNLYPKDVALSMTVTSPANPVQFCTNTTAGEHLIDYTATVANTAVGNAEGLVFEAVFPAGYAARTGTSKLTYNGTTKTLSDPVYNSTRGTWEWNISTDPNGTPFLPGAASGANSFVFTYQGETSCGFVSGTSVSYNMRSTSGCGKVIEYKAAGAAMELSMKPSSLNTYYLAPSVVALKNDGSGSVYQIEVTNQGTQPLQAGESIFVTIPTSLDYVTGSVVHVTGAANVGEPTATIVGNTRVLKFPLPTGADNVTLNQNETARFSIQLKIVDAKPLSCGVTADAITLEAIYSVPGVTCGATPCDVSVITGNVKSNIDITKTSFTITPVSGVAKYATTTNNDVTVKYTITNAGTIANSAPIVVDFFNDLNKDGLYTGTEPIFYTQTITGGAQNLAAGAVSAEQTTATFTVPESASCNIVAVIRAANNAQVCADTSVNTPVKFESATTAFSVCAGSNVTIGNPSNGATISWSPATYLSDATVSNPVFNYNGATLTMPTDFTYTATITHAGGCTSTFTNTITVNPLPVATIAYPNASYCNRGTAAVTLTGVTGGTFTGDTGLVINSTTGAIDLAMSTTGNHDVSYSFTDGTCQNTVKTVIRINATVLPGTLSNITGQCSVTPAAPTLTDPCAGTITATTATAFPITAQGTTVVTWTFNYGNGFTKTATQNVVLTDTTAPVAPTLADLSDECSVTPTAPIAVDNCKGNVTGTTTTVFPITAQGPTLIEWTFDDGNGNTSTATQNVTIQDVTAPVTPTLNPVTSKCPVTLTAPTTTDNCAGTVTGTTATSFPITAKGNTNVTWTFDDGHSNTTTAVQVVTILDITADISGGTAVCENAASPKVTFTGAGGTAPYTFTYTRNGGTNQTVTTVSGNSVDVDVPTDTAGTFTYSLVSVRDADAACENLQIGTAAFTINPLPTVVTVNPAAVCSGTAVDLTAAGVTAGSTAGLTYAYFTDAAGTAALASPNAVTAGGTYYIQGTTAEGCKSAVEPVTVTVNPTPTVAIVNPAAVCQGITVDLTAAAVTAGSTAGLTYAYYTDAAGTAALASPNAVTAGGTYYIQGTTAEGCKSAVEPVTVTVNPTPTVAIVNPAAVCQGTTVDLTAAAVTAGSTAGLTYAYYTDAAGTAALASPNAVTAGGTYYIQGTTAAGCPSAIQSVTVTINPTPTVVIVNPAAVCSGTTVDLTAAAVTAGSTAGLTYAYFTDAAGTAALANPNAVTASGTYYIQGTTAQGCKSAVEPVAVTIDSTPALAITNPAAVCSGTSVDLTAAAVTAGSAAGLTYAYYTDAAGTAALANPNAVTAGGTYYIQGTAAGGCKSAIEPVIVTVNPTPVVVTVNPAAVCQGTTVDLTAAAVTAGSTAGLTYAYFTDAAGTTVLAAPSAVTASGTYYIQGTTAAGCKSAVEPVAVTIDSTPALAITNPAAVCSGTSVDLTAAAVTAGSAAGLTYAYYTDAAGTAALANPNAVTAGGTYYIQGTAAGGCKSAIEPVIVTVNPTPTVVTVNPAAICSGASTDLTAAAVTAGSTAGLTYAYYTDAAGTAALANPSAVTAAGTYYIQGTTAAGCPSAIQPVTVTVNALLALNGSESTACAADGTGYVLSFSVTGQSPYTVTGTGAPGTWSGNDWTSDKILAGTDYNVSVQDAYMCNTITVANTAPICCVYEVTVPTFPAATVACYSEIPTASTLTKAEYEALGNGDGNIGDTPCGVIEITASNSVDPGCNGNVTRTYTVTEYADPNNNKVRDAGEDTVLNTTKAEQTFTIARADFAMPANAGATVACASEVTAPAVPEVKDNCGNVLVASAPAISPMPACNGTVTYTYTFTDCAGHAHDWVYTYTIDNTVAPQGKAPANLTVQCIGDIPVASINAVTNLSGNCNNSVTVTVADTNNGGSGCSSNPYVVTRTYTLTDCGGLTTQLVQTITAADTTKPVFVEALPSNMTLECTDALPAAPTLTATDNCSTATVNFSEVKVNGSCAGNYQLVRTWTAADACGNTAVHTQTVNVVDTKAPVFAEALPEKLVSANCSTIPEAATLTATDECSSATVTFSEVRVDGSCNGRYQLVRTWTAEDGCGNQNIATQTVDVSCLEVFNGLSPNGDGINDTLEIGGIDCFPNNAVKIYNRYGVLVYEKNGYDNVTNPFAGLSDGRATVLKGDKLPTGTYFYTLEYDDNGKQVSKSGYIYISNQ